MTFILSINTPPSYIGCYHMFNTDETLYKPYKLYKQDLYGV